MIGIAVGVIPLTIPSNELPREFLSFNFKTLGSTELEILVPRTEILPPWSLQESIKFKLQSHFGPLVTRVQQAEKGIIIIILAGAIDSGHQKKVGLLSHTEKERNMYGTKKDLCGISC